MALARFRLRADAIADTVRVAARCKGAGVREFFEACDYEANVQTLLDMFYTDDA